MKPQKTITPAKAEVQCVCNQFLQVVFDSQLRGELLEEALPAAVVKRRTVVTFAWVLGYLLAIWLLGFPIGGPLCAFLQLRFCSREKWFLSLVLALSAWFFIYGIFDFLLHVPFPDGEIFTRLDKIYVLVYVLIT